MLLNNLTNTLDKLFNKTLALPDDPVGLQVGRPEKDIGKALLTLDITFDVMDEAIKEKAGLIIAHHPLIFDPVKNILGSDVRGRMLLSLIENNIAAYIAHTNFDAMHAGLNRGIAGIIGLKNIEILEGTGLQWYKFTVFVPPVSADAVRDDSSLACKGSLEPAQLLPGFMKNLKKSLNLDFLRFAAPPGIDIARMLVKSAAFINGSANSFTDRVPVQNLDCDLIIVGELKYSKVVEVVQCGKVLIELGHGESEKIAIDMMHDILILNSKDLQGLKFIKSKNGFTGWRYYID